MAIWYMAASIEYLFLGIISVSSLKTDQLHRYNQRFQIIVDSDSRGVTRRIQSFTLIEQHQSSIYSLASSQFHHLKQINFIVIIRDSRQSQILTPEEQLVEYNPSRQFISLTVYLQLEAISIESMKQDQISSLIILKV
ncbi:MAG: hypothetical protein EZS28_020551 [Streblomastix strix]|uniref:Uncharacterized protein n=1 Tax=Streblomastix strix TaxID=222440 RepID=A0A5J4VMW9_9EUKA|nr:MAG: hypothetical protein EZS28_020551 [Streblomastix strix]